MTKTDSSAGMEAAPARAVIRPFVLKLLVLLAFATTLYGLYLLGSVVTTFLLAGFLTVLFSPALDWLARRRINDLFGLILILFASFLLVATILLTVIPIFVGQIGALAARVSETFVGLDAAYRAGGIDALGLPGFVTQYMRDADLTTALDFLREHASSLGKMVGDTAKQVATSGISVVSTVSAGMFEVALLVVFTFFMSLERHGIKTFIYEALPKNVARYVRAHEEETVGILGAWIRGQLILALVIGALTFFGLLVLGLFGYWLDGMFMLAVLAGLMEFIPYVGPLIALLPAVAVASGMGMGAVIAVIILYVVIQQIENNIVVPSVMSRALDVSPFFVLLMMTVGGSLFGIVGILLAIPCAALLKMLVRDALAYKKSRGW